MLPRRRADFVILAALLLLPACSARTAVTPAVEPPDPPVQLTPDDVIALAELLRMEDVRTLDTLLIARHLASGQPEVRARAALAAGRIGDHAATPLLLTALQDSQPSVRARAAFALGELGDSSAAVIHALGAVAAGSNSAAAVEAIGAIGRLAASTGRIYIDSLLTRARVADAVRREALIVAWRLPLPLDSTVARTARWVPHDSTALAHTARWLQHADPELRWRAAYSLARTGGARAVAPLLAVIADPDERVRAQAVRGMRAVLADSAAVRDRAFAALLAATTDSSAHVRINALAQLPAYRDRSRATTVIAARLEDADPNVRVAAAQALAQQGDRMAVNALRVLASSDAPAGVRSPALVSLTRLDTAAAAGLAAQWADSASWLLRLYAARSLAAAPWQDAAAPLQRLARDTHYLVATEALNAIRTGDSLPQTRPLFIERLGAAHPLERAAAARGLARYVTVADLDVLLQAYDRARRDATPEAANAIVRALIRLRHANVPVARSFFLRFAAAPPTDRGVYRLIADSIGTPPDGWVLPERPGPEARPLDFYADIIARYVAPVLAGADAPRAVISTEHGDIVLELASADAPLTVHNFVSLIERGYYVNTRWHRVVPNFVIQDGDPRGDGSGGPGYAIRDEINPLRYLGGVLGMAHSGADTGGGQWFITHSPQPHLDGGYTVFGRVIDGMTIVDRVVQDEPILGMRILR